MMKKLIEFAFFLSVGAAGLILSATTSFSASRATTAPKASALIKSTSAEKPEAFVRRVYARYRTFDSPGVSMDRPDGTPFYSTTLLDAFAKESALAQGEVGAIDADPLCACQAYENLRLKAVSIEESGAETVKARVDFANLGSRQTAVLTLIRTPDGWRIADVGNKNMKSVMAVLKAEIAHPIQDATPRKSDRAPNP